MRSEALLHEHCNICVPGKKEKNTSATSASLCSSKVKERAPSCDPALVHCCVVHGVYQLITEARLLQVTEQLRIYNKFLAQLVLLQATQNVSCMMDFL